MNSAKNGSPLNNLKNTLKKDNEIPPIKPTKININTHYK